MKTLLLLPFLFSTLSSAFVPPVGSVIKEIFDVRKPGVVIELTYKHQVEVAQGTTVTVDESFLYSQGKGYFLWKTPNHVPVYGVQERKAYLVGSDRKMNARSFLYTKYLGTASAEDFKEQLISEQFIRRDQLLQYKPGYTFEGDPDSWQVQENYVKHPDVRFKRLDSMVTIAVQGMDDPQNNRTVFFDAKFQGVRKFEWKEGGNTSSWSFSDFNKYQDGLFPKSMRFEQNGSELVSSELIQVRGLKDKAFQNTLKAWQKSGLKNTSSGSLEDALKVLLSYR